MLLSSMGQAFLFISIIFSRSYLCHACLNYTCEYQRLVLIGGNGFGGVSAAFSRPYSGANKTEGL